jgi:hypothetical protein
VAQATQGLSEEDVLLAVSVCPPKPAAGSVQPLSARSALFVFCVFVIPLLAACASRSPTVAPLGPGASLPAVKLIVDADGLYEVTAADLATVGFELANADPKELALSTAGRPVPFLLTGAGRGRALRFYGQAPGRDAYLPQNVYWLTHDRREGTADRREGTADANAGAQPADLLVRPAPPPGSELTTVVSTTVRAEEQRQYAPKADTWDNRWFWASLFAPGTLKITVATPNLAGGEAILRVGLWGNSAAPVNPDHRLVVTLNGTAVADDAWDGMAGHVLTATVPAGILRGGDNQLALTAPGDTGAEADAVLLDWVEVTYRRELVADGGELIFAGRGAGFSVTGLGPDAILWEITDPGRPIALTGYRVNNGQLRFGSDAAERRFIAVAPAGLRKPRLLIPAASPDEAATWGQELRAWPGGADLIVVTVPQFRPALEPLVAARRAAGLRVAVVDLAAVYDAFTFGRPDPAAIQALVRRATTSWTPPAPRFLLLAGDASYDPVGHLKGPEADLVPTRLIQTAHTGWTASDVWFALPDDAPTAHPALAVGRFPAQTAGQLAAMVAKTLAYEAGETAGAWRTRALLVADNDDQDFVKEAQAFARTATNYTSEVVTVAGDGLAARAELLKAFGDGTGLVGYFGHGSLNLWAQEKVFSSEEAAKLSNRDRLPIVFTVTCLSGFFQHPSTLSLAEALLRNRDGGAVAALVPSSAALLPDQRFLAASLARALAVDLTPGQTLGETILRAQAALPDTPGVREILLTFNLLGDPALRLR